MVPGKIFAAAALVCAAALTAAPSICRGQDRPAQNDAPKLFKGVGVVKAIDAPSGVVTIRHEPIDGLMDAMTMQFSARPASLLAGLKPNDKVEFTLDGKSYAILAIARAKPEK